MSVKNSRVEQLKERAEAGTLSSRDYKTVVALIRQTKRQVTESEGEKLSIAFGKRLRELRTEMGLSREEFAERAGWHPSFVAQIENGFKKNLQMKTLCEAAAALEMQLKVVLEKS